MLHAVAQIIGSVELVNETSENKITFACIALGALQSLTVLGDQGARTAEEEKEVNLEEEVLESWRRKEKSLINYTEVMLYFVSGFFFNVS